MIAHLGGGEMHHLCSVPDSPTLNALHISAIPVMLQGEVSLAPVARFGPNSVKHAASFGDTAVTDCSQ